MGALEGKEISHMKGERSMYQYEELGWFSLGKVLLESPCECGIEPPGSISHGVSGI